MKLCYALLSFIVILAFPLSGVSQSPSPQNDWLKGKPNDVIETIGFGSCLNQNRPQAIWNAILASKPQIFIFLGDNIYADSGDLSFLRSEYQKLGEQHGYQELKKHAHILATWDDHDYGGEDIGAELSSKEISKQAFLEFFEIPKDSPRRARPGIYDAYVFGPPGKRVQIILLDTRTFRGPLIPAPMPEPHLYKYLQNQDPNATFLGEAQWRWLEKQLQVPADLRIIGSSVQILAEQYGLETWANFPHERTRFFALLKKSNAKNVLIISGDRHFAELSRLDGVLHYPLLDFTSSSLNQNKPDGSWPNRLRVAGPYLKKNFGLISIKWEKNGPQVHLEVRDPGNYTKFEADQDFHNE